MIDAADSDRLGPEAANAVIIGRTLAGRAAIRATREGRRRRSRAASAFYRSLGWSGCSAHSRPARFHPLQEKPQKPSSRADLPSAWTLTAERRD
jgi:hypothetical protein